MSLIQGPAVHSGPPFRSEYVQRLNSFCHTARCLTADPPSLIAADRRYITRCNVTSILQDVDIFALRADIMNVDRYYDNLTRDCWVKLRVREIGDTVDRQH